MVVVVMVVVAVDVVVVVVLVVVAVVVVVVGFLACKCFPNEPFDFLHGQVSLSLLQRCRNQ